MFVYGWSVLELRFGLLILSFYPMGSFAFRVKDDPLLHVESQGIVRVYVFISY